MMAQQKCEKCGSTDFKREGDYYVCQYCGAEYPAGDSEPSSVSPAPAPSPAGRTPVNVQINVNRSQKGIPQEMKSEKSWTLTLLLAIFFGYFGIHRFYAGKLCTGVLWFCTAGCFCVGWLGDVCKIAMGKFTDSNGKYIRRH